MKEHANKLWSIANLFNANLRSLRVFSEEVGCLADQQDEVIQERPLQLAADEFGIPVEEIKSEVTALEADWNIDLSQPWDVNNPTTEQQQVLQMLNRDFTTLAQENPQAAEQSFLLLDAATNILPNQGELLRRGALFNLWSYFENLLADLIQAHYLMHAQALSSDCTITLSQLREIGSVEEAEAYLGAREAESVQRKSLDDQLEYFQKRLNVDLRPLRLYRECLREIALRRNLLIHNQGVVNHIYLSQASPSYVDQQEIQPGQTLDVTEAYLFQALDTVYVAGMILLQQCWRQWVRDPQWILLADFVLNHKGIYQALVDTHYELACRLSEYAAKIKLSNEANTRGIMINHAIALKVLGDLQGMEQLLTSVDWTACAPEYQIALFALRDEYEKLFDLLPKAIKLGAVKSTDLAKWPLFDPVRDDPQFASLLESINEESNQ